MHPIPGNEDLYLLFNEAKPSHRFWLAPELHLLYMCSFHLVCLLSLLFPWPCIPKYPPVLPNLRRQQSHVLHWNLLYSLRNFNSPVTLNSRSTSFCDAGLKSLGSKLAFFIFYWLVSPSTNLQMPLWVVRPLLAFTLPHSTHSLYFWCPPLSQWDYPCAVLVLGRPGNQEIFIPGTCFNRDILSSTLHWILCSLRFSISVVSTMLSRAANNMSNIWDSQSTNVHWVHF